MNIHAELRAAGGLSAPTVSVQIASVATAVPAHVTGQEEVAERAQKIFPQYARLDSLYKNTGIERRYSVEPKEWYLQPHTWEDRTRSYQRHALDLLERVATQAVAEAGLTLRDIDTIVTNTVTGLAIPSLDARLMNRLAFRPGRRAAADLRAGLRWRCRRARPRDAHGAGAARLQRSVSHRRPVLALPAHRRPEPHHVRRRGAVWRRSRRRRAAQLRPATRHGDGAPACATVGAIGEYFWSKTEHIMGWDIKNDGFGIVLSPDLPALMRERLGEALFPFFAREGLSLQDFDGLLLHPGGSKILQTVEDALGLPRERIRYSWDVLKNYGNMSSATAIFVLKQALADGVHGRYLAAAFGPGFSGFFVVLDL